MKWLADLAIQNQEGRYVKLGSLVYLETPDVSRVRLIKSVANGANLIGKCLSSVPVYVDGDVFLGDEKVGHIHSQENGVGDPIYWAKITTDIEVEDSVWLDVEMN